MHSRNKHKNGYDFDALVSALPELAKFLIVTPRNTTSIDFTNRNAVVCLNKALLKFHYGVQYWELGGDFLCPPVPGRADYIHALADLLKMTSQERLISNVNILDIGTGANLIYPLVGFAEYGWQFEGSDINPSALKCAQAIIDANKLKIKLHQQQNPQNIFHGVIKPNQYFDITMCNPPFHADEQAATQGTQRKWRNLNRRPSNSLNFGGNNNELWCEGGERRFIKTMIRESKDFADQVGWFTCLVSNKDNLFPLKKALKKLEPEEIKVVKMAQGQKQSRFLAWRFN